MIIGICGGTGSGKTTVLRLIAGFESPNSGTESLDGVDVTRRDRGEGEGRRHRQDGRGETGDQGAGHSTGLHACTLKV